MKQFQRVKRILFLILTSLFAICLAPGLGFVLSMTAAGESAGLFPEINGREKSEDIEVYTPENLFDYIDGAAELYLSYGFRELQVAEYRDEAGVLIVVEVYHHKTPVHAFGIYSQEQPTDGNFLDIGARAYIEETFLNFVIADYYVKIMSYGVQVQTQEVLKTLAKRVAENLGGEASLPPVLAAFPDKDRRHHSEKFVSKNFLGYNFLHSGFTADYGDSNMTFTLFIIEGEDSTDCAQMLRRYMQFAEHPQKEVPEGEYTLSDPDHGEVAIFWRGKYIWGVLNLAEADLRSEYLLLTEKCLRNIKMIE